MFCAIKDYCSALTRKGVLTLLTWESSEDTMLSEVKSTDKRSLCDSTCTRFLEQPSPQGWAAEGWSAACKEGDIESFVAMGTEVPLCRMKQLRVQVTAMWMHC